MLKFNISSKFSYSMVVHMGLELQTSFKEGPSGD